LCVNPGGTKGCLATIGAAIAAPAPNDTINVVAGTYKEDVIVNKSLSLIGANQNNTIIDATGLANGISFPEYYRSLQRCVPLSAVKRPRVEG